MNKPAQADGSAEAGRRPPSNRRMVLRWVGLMLFMAILGTVFVNLGQWQLRRLHERRDRNATTIAAQNAPTAPYASIFGKPIRSADEWRSVTVSGTFDAEHQLVVRYRSNADARGYEVVTPLHTGNGSTVLVDRGFVLLPGGNPIPSVAPAPPAGEVQIIGQVRLDEPGPASAIVPVNGQVRSVNAAAIARTLPYPITAGYIDLVSVQPPQPAGFAVVQPPELSDGPHLWYAVQWFMFTGIGVLGIIVFIRSDIRERGARRRPADPPPTDEDGAPD